MQPTGTHLASRNEVDRHIAVLRDLVPAIARAIGPHCEVVVHDFRQPEHSIVAIAGGLTGRQIGGAMSQLGLSVMAAGDAAEPQYDYVTRSPNGRVMRSTTLPLRDRDGHVFGAFCINVDTTDLQAMATMLSGLIGTADAPGEVTFADDISVVIDQVIREEQLRIGHTVDRLDKSERMEILEALDRRGVFSMQRAVPQVADHLGVSRVTVYTYLRELRGDAGEGTGPGSAEAASQRAKRSGAGVQASE